MELPETSYTVRAARKRPGARFRGSVLAESSISYLREQISEAFVLTKDITFSGVLAFGGSASHLVTVKVSEPEQPTFPGPNMIVARTLCRTPGALECLLMLADVGSATPRQLIESAVDEKDFSKAITELLEGELVVFQSNMVSLTEKGSLLVKKLRASDSNRSNRDV
jgi:predicted transcriptional regulator